MDWTALAILVVLLTLFNLYHLYKDAKNKETIWVLQRINDPLMQKLNDLGYVVDIERFGDGAVSVFIYPGRQSEHTNHQVS